MHNYAHLFPKHFNRYIEPFLGSGAPFFALTPKKAILSDINSDLINAYNQVKLHPDKIIQNLTEHSKRHSKEYYYEIRKFNFNDPVDRASQFIYLNRTCWNGLYRVNLKGEFNVPIGTKNNVLLDTDDFIKTSSHLSSATLLCCDFTEASKNAESGDFIYYDPPYTVQHNNNNFIKYNKKLFSWNDQILLFETAKRAAKKGAKVAISNACHESLITLYRSDFKIHILCRDSSISGKNSGRKGTNEILATSY